MMTVPSFPFLVRKNPLDMGIYCIFILVNHQLLCLAQELIKSPKGNDAILSLTSRVHKQPPKHDHPIPLFCF